MPKLKRYRASRANPNLNLELETLKDLDADCPGLIARSYASPQFLIGRALIDDSKPFASALIDHGRLQRIWLRYPEALFMCRAIHNQREVCLARETAQ